MTTITFGKYRNQDIEDIFETDIYYCKWMYRQKMLLDQNPDIKHFLQLKLVGTDTSYVMPYGKFKGLSLDKIYTINPNYIDWLKSNCKNESLMNELNKYP